MHQKGWSLEEEKKADKFNKIRNNPKQFIIEEGIKNPLHKLWIYAQYGRSVFVGELCNIVLSKREAEIKAKEEAEKAEIRRKHTEPETGDVLIELVGVTNREYKKFYNVADRINEIRKNTLDNLAVQKRIQEIVKKQRR